MAGRIPTRFDFKGDEKSGRMLISRAQSELGKLQTDIKNGKGIEQLHRTVHLDDGSIIECWSGFGTSQVTITTHGFGSISGAERKECFCNCGLAVGQIVNYLRVGCYDFMDPEQTYDVKICRRKRSYTLITEAIPMVMYPYYNGQDVLVIFEPDPIEDPYSTGRNGCAAIRCRISPIMNHEAKYRYYSL